ncbi:SDR family NAD(P)-dependent oxidoreductase [Desulfoluna butyratoxydans]|uniref:Enoyl-(Acyl carrier protein) reductase n=1 Tax=Desulfoluna butyratoxydans TaxID=231438 RepID=A0A4U8YSI3_9BACT|nr:SDR family oxidoreductase [Desulfoluna butyratoxydans]VFQ46299.1 enoyl-(acyl carrier protein) reductase [Desulfoluna butyratoxydans]
MESLGGKTALITGGSDGIGFAVATAFAARGANLVLIERDPEKLKRRKKSLGQYPVDVLAVAADISNRDEVTGVAGEVSDHGMKIDIIVNNAGIARFVPFEETDESLLAYHLALNVCAPYAICQVFLEDLLASRGNIINVSSYFARRMLPDRPSTAYSLTKGALESFTRALAFELGPKGVRVNAIAPGTVTTPQVEKNMERLDQGAKDRFKAMVRSIYPMQALGDPEDVAHLAAFLASDQARWITGGIFPVDGGLTTN